MIPNAIDCIHACKDARSIQEFINQVSLCAREVVKAKAYVPGVFFWECSTDARKRAYQTVVTKISDPCFSDLTMQCLVLLYENKDSSVGVRVRIQFQAGSLISHTDFLRTRFDPAKQDLAEMPAQVVRVLRQLYGLGELDSRLNADWTAAVGQALDDFEALRMP